MNFLGLDNIARVTNVGYLKMYCRLLNRYQVDKSPRQFVSAI